MFLHVGAEIFPSHIDYNFYIPMNKLLAICFAFALAATGSVAIAHEHPDQGVRGQELGEDATRIERIQVDQEQIRDRITDHAENVRERIQSGTEDFREIRAERMEAQEQVRADIQERVEQVRDAQRENIEDRQAEFRQRAQDILDERRFQLAERLMSRINMLNENLSDRYVGFLHSLEIVLDKIESRTVKIEESQGIDLSSVHEAIESARGDIETARGLIADQKGKVYVVEIGDRSTIGTDFQSTMQELREDHTQLRERVLTPLRGVIGNLSSLIRSEIDEIRGTEEDDVEDEVEEDENEEEESEDETEEEEE